jgi:protein SCO1/2
LTGKQKDISRLADAVGFRYTYDKANQRYSHAAATYFLSSDGRICRYFLALGTEPDQFKLALAEAAEGKLTSSLADAIIQMCYMYDPDANRYSADARRMMAFGGAAFTMLLLGFTAPFWFARRSVSPPPQLAGQELTGPQAPAEGAAKVSSSRNTAEQPLAAAYNNQVFNVHHDSSEVQK